MTTSQAGAWLHDPETTDDSEGLAWIRTHRLYCLALATIVALTLVGATWADQPRGRMGVTSSAPGAAIDVADPPAPAPLAQPER